MKKGWAVVALCVPAVALNFVSRPEPDVHAQSSPATVVLLQQAKPDPVTTEALARVRGELKAAGFEVVVLPLHPVDAKHDLETAGALLAPVAAFALFVSSSDDGGTAAEIWVSDRVRQKTIIQRAVLDEVDRGRGSKILAVQAVEVLKANLAAFWSPAARAESAASAAPPPAQSAGRPPRESPPAAPSAALGPGAGLGIGVEENFGGVGVTWAPYAFVSYRWPQGLSVRARFDGLGPSVRLSAREGSARIDQQLATIEAVKAWSIPLSIEPFALAAAGAQHVQVTGTGAPPNAGHTSDDWSAATALGGGLSVPLLSWVSLLLQARAIVSWPTTEVRIADVDVGRIGAALMVDGGLLGVLQ